MKQLWNRIKKFLTLDVFFFPKCPVCKSKVLSMYMSRREIVIIPNKFSLLPTTRFTYECGASYEDLGKGMTMQNKCNVIS